jgi:hypothetical protein
MKKPKFVWNFKLIEDNTELQIDLNGGMSRAIYLAHPKASQHIAEALTEILRFEHDVATKTEVYNIQTVYHALSIAHRNLTSLTSWGNTLYEAERKIWDAERTNRQQGEN